MVLYANINALNFMRAAIGSQCKLTKRGVTFFILSYIIFGSLKMNLAAAFWINCNGLIELAGRPDQGRFLRAARCGATQQNTIALIIISDAVSTLDAAQRDKSPTENCCRVLFITY